MRGSDVRVGLCGFTISMGAYAARFPVVEVQGTFYQPPKDAVMQRWRASTGASLEYAIKVWQLVTHPASSPTYRRMKRKLEPADVPGFFGDSDIVREGWARSVECARLLGATGMLFQCPASFRPNVSNIAAMRNFFRRIERPPARLMWEPRGREWIEQQDLARALCLELGLVHVVDPFVTPPRSGEAVYWRLHGIGGARNSYTDSQLDELRAVLEQTRPSNTSYVLFNNLPRVGDAERFCRLLRG